MPIISERIRPGWTSPSPQLVTPPPLGGKRAVTFTVLHGGILTMVGMHLDLEIGPTHSEVRYLVSMGMLQPLETWGFANLGKDDSQEPTR